MLRKQVKLGFRLTIIIALQFNLLLLFLIFIILGLFVFHRGRIQRGCAGMYRKSIAAVTKNRII